MRNENKIVLYTNVTGTNKITESTLLLSINMKSTEKFKKGVCGPHCSPETQFLMMNRL